MKTGCKIECKITISWFWKNLDQVSTKSQLFLDQILIKSRPDLDHIWTKSWPILDHFSTISRLGLGLDQIYTKSRPNLDHLWTKSKNLDRIMTIFSSKPHNFSAKLKPNLYQGLDHMSALFLRRLGQLSTLSMVEVAYVRIHYIIEVSKWARIKSKFWSVQISNRRSISHFPSHVTVGFILSDEI